MIKIRSPNGLLLSQNIFVFSLHVLYDNSPQFVQEKLKNSSLRVEAVKRDFVAVTKSVYGQDAYTAFLHVAHKHARSNSPKQCAVQKSTRIDA